MYNNISGTTKNGTGAYPTWLNHGLHATVLKLARVEKGQHKYNLYLLAASYNQYNDIPHTVPTPHCGSGRS